MPIELLLVGIVAMWGVIILVGGRMVWLRVPALQRLRVKRFRATPPPRQRIPAYAAIHRRAIHRLTYKQFIKRRVRASAVVRVRHTARPIPADQSLQRDITKHRPLTDKQEPLVIELLQAGWSANKILTLVGGDRNLRLAEMREIRHGLDAARLAAMIARHEPTPPELLHMEPVPQGA